MHNYKTVIYSKYLLFYKHIYGGRKWCGDKGWGGGGE